MSKNHLAQQLEELRVFRLFMSISKLAIDPGSEKNADEPAPDIYCTMANVPNYFEIGTVTDEKIAEQSSLTGKAYDSFDPFEQPLMKMMRKKADTVFLTTPNLT
jgi:hypothetical protein